MKTENRICPPYLPFEEKLEVLDGRINLIQGQIPQKGASPKETSRLIQLQLKQAKILKRTYSKLTGWETVLVARHPGRPILTDYLNSMVTDVCELHGDHCFGDDPAIFTGLGKINDEKILIVGNINPRTSAKERIAHNFGMAHPEGYRKALAKMKFAAKFGLPIVTLIDTPGAYPGIGAEERGQAQAIAVNLFEISRLPVPIICICIGEGGSGGALGIGVGDRLAMLEFAYYSVISPEGCASILWKDPSQKSGAAESLKLRSKDLLKLGLIDTIIPEPLGGAHRNPSETINSVGDYISNTLKELKEIEIDTLIKQRYQRIRSMGATFITNRRPSAARRLLRLKNKK